VPYVEFQQQLYRLRPGENRLGAGPEASIRVPGAPAGFLLVISLETRGAYAWSAHAGAVMINGRPLPGEPVPLFHGDRISLDRFTFEYVDDGGAPTVVIERPAPAAVAKTHVESAAAATEVEPDLLRRATPPAPERRPVAVLRRSDTGQSYVIGNSGFRIGREKRSDLIIPDRSISRLCAEIGYDHGAYLLRRLGRTTIRVNGKKLGEPHRLALGDVVTIGRYEFTFLRRPAGAEDIVQAEEATPVRSAVPDAPTVEVSARGGSNALTWFLLALLGLVAGAALFFA
jgi:pSer/pThr/pTyr-binding forkhead associated (FHA) protein